MFNVLFGWTRWEQQWESSWGATESNSEKVLRLRAETEPEDLFWKYWRGRRFFPSLSLYAFFRVKKNDGDFSIRGVETSQPFTQTATWTPSNWTMLPHFKAFHTLQSQQGPEKLCRPGISWTVPLKLQSEILYLVALGHPPIEHCCHILKLSIHFLPFDPNRAQKSCPVPESHELCLWNFKVTACLVLPNFQKVAIVLVTLNVCGLCMEH